MREPTGESRTYAIPFELGPLAVGSSTIRGAIPGLAEPLVFTGHTSSFPWALVLIPIVVVGQWVLLRGRNRLRDRLAPEEGGPVAPLALEAGAPPSTEPREEPVVEPEAAAPMEPTPVVAAVAPSIVDDPDRLVGVVTAETVASLLEAVGDRLLTRGEIWSLADVVSEQVGVQTAAALGLDGPARR